MTWPNDAGGSSSRRVLLVSNPNQIAAGELGFLCIQSELPKGTHLTRISDKDVPGIVRAMGLEHDCYVDCENLKKLPPEDIGEKAGDLPLTSYQADMSRKRVAYERSLRELPFMR